MIQAASTTVISFPEFNWGPWVLDRYVVKDLFGFLSIAWYGLIICVGMILGCAVVLRNATKKEGFNLDSFLDYFIFCIPIGVVGARVMYVLSKLEMYDSFSEMIAIWNGGIAIYGAVIAGALAILVVAKVKKHNPLKVFDAMVPGLLLAQAIGRWGNFVNGEAHGTVTDLPWGMMVNGEGPVHPTFLYESLITFTGFLLASFLVYRFKKADGQVFCFYLTWYGIGRTLVEGLRTDSLYVGSLRLAQCIGILTALGGVILFVLLTVLKKNPAPAEGEAAEENGGESLPAEAVSAEAVTEAATAEEAPAEEETTKEAPAEEETVKEDVDEVPPESVAADLPAEEKEGEDGTDH
ncbi:MAG: prolipoprotein diacylglyceryl transferase [Clostridia bacterium]|nr:prolipoprotein diacylglyceryl transferase [Clostridia bacterium]